MKLRTLSRESLVAAALCLVQGCASLQAPPPPPSHAADWLVSLGRVGLDVKTISPQLESNFAISGKGDGAASGAANGAGACLGFLAGGGPIGAAGAILCLPFGVILGGVAGVITTASERERAALAETVASQNLTARISRLLHEAILAYGRESGLQLVDLSGRESDEGRSSAPRRPDDVDAVDTLLEVTPAGFRFNSTGSSPLLVQFSLAARVRILGAHDGRERDELTVTTYLPALKPEEMAADDYRALKEGLAFAYEDLAEKIVDESLLLYHPLADCDKAIHKKTGDQAESGSGSKQDDPRLSRIPDWTLAPLTPKYDSDICLFSSKCYLASNVPLSAEVNPNFSWLALPEALETTEFAGRVSAISYEFRLYEKGKGLFILSAHPNTLPGGVPGKLIYFRKNLSSPQHRTEVPLKPCNRYYWTVRMHYTLDGQPRVTEWMGSYKAPAVDKKPWLWRRSYWPELTLRVPIDKWHYLPFDVECNKGKQ